MVAFGTYDLIFARGAGGLLSKRITLDDLTFASGAGGLLSNRITLDQH